MPSDPKELERRKFEYGLFLWRLNKALPALRTLYDQAVAAAPVDVANIADELENRRARTLADTLPALFYGAAITIRDDINGIVRHSCAGGILQVMQTLLEGFVDAIGVSRAHPLGHRYATPDASVTQPFSRVLWSARNAYVHGGDWRAAGASGKVDPRSRLPIDTLKAVGVEDPKKANAFELLEILAGGGDIDSLRRSLIEAAREALEAPSSGVTHVGQGAQIPEFARIGWFAIVLIVLALIFPVFRGREPSVAAIVYVFGEGDDRIAVKIASGSITSPDQLIEKLRDAAATELAPNDVAKYLEYRQLEKAFEVLCNEIVAYDPERDDFTERVLSVCDTAEQLFHANRALPDPIAEYIIANYVPDDPRPKEQALHAILADLLARQGFEAHPYEERRVPPGVLDNIADSQVKAADI